MRAAAIAAVLSLLIIGCARRSEVAVQATPTGEATAAETAAATPAESPASGAPTVATGASPAATATGPTNLVTLDQGTIARAWPPTDNDNSSPFNLLWDNGWQSKAGSSGPFVFIFELAAPAQLESLGFVTSGDSHAAESVRVEGSTQNATGGYATIGDYALKAVSDEQDFSLSPPVTARWLRITIAQRAGDYTSIQKILANGTLQVSHPPSVAGLWLEDHNLNVSQDPLLGGSTLPAAPDRSAFLDQAWGRGGYIVQVVEQNGVLRGASCWPGKSWVMDSFGGTQDGSTVSWLDAPWAKHPADFSVINAEGAMIVGHNDMMIRLPGGPACDKVEPPAGSGQNVLVLSNDGRMSMNYYPPASPADFPGFRFTGRAVSLLSRDALTGVDTVVMSCVDQADSRIAPWQAQALIDFVGAGHKLIIYDADKCGSPLTYSFLPYQFKASNPGAQGAGSKNLFLVESDTLGSADKNDQQHFWDPHDYLTGPSQQIGDSNTVTTSDPHWCGHLFGTNVLNVNGFMQMYAVVGRGLIIYDGFDQDNRALTPVMRLESLELRQPVPAFLPCKALVAGKFIIEPSKTVPFVLGRPASVQVPLLVLANQGWAGTVNLSSKAPTDAPWKSALSTAQVALKGDTASLNLSISVPASAQAGGHDFVVSGDDGQGHTSSATVTLVAEAPPKVVKVKPVTKGCVEKLTLGSDTLFAFGEATLTPTAQKTLALVGPTIARAGKHPVHIYGYTDAIGSDSYNQALSEQRARSVRDWLAAHGYVKTSTQIQGFGKQHPVAPNTNPDGSDNPQGRAKNRRVEVQIDTCR